MKRGFPKKWAIVFYVVLGSATVGALLWLSMSRTRVDPLTPEERQDLVKVDEIAGPRLRHPMLGFTLAHPGPKFFASAEAEVKLGFGHDPSTRFHAFTELDTGRMVIVALSRRSGMGGGDFKKAVDSIAQMFTQKTAAGFDKEAKVDFAQHDVDTGRREARIHVVIAERAHLRIDARVAKFAGSADYLLMVIAVAPADDSLAPVVASVTPPV